MQEEGDAAGDSEDVAFVVADRDNREAAMPLLADNKRDEEFGLSRRVVVVVVIILLLLLLLALLFLIKTDVFLKTFPGTFAMDNPEDDDAGGDIPIGGSTPAPTAAAGSGSQVETAGDSTATIAAAMV